MKRNLEYWWWFWSWLNPWSWFKTSRHKKHEETKRFPFSPENKISRQDKFSNYMYKVKSKTYIPCEKLFRDLCDLKRYLISHRISKSFVKPGMVVEKDHEVYPLRRSIWLKPCSVFLTDKRTVEKIDSDKDLPKSMNCSYFGRTMENVRNRVNLELMKKDDNIKFVKLQSKLPFNVSQKLYKNMKPMPLNTKKYCWMNQYFWDLLCWKYQNCCCMKHILTNLSHILEKKIYHHIIPIQIASFWV